MIIFIFFLSFIFGILLRVPNFLAPKLLLLLIIIGFIRRQKKKVFLISFFFLIGGFIISCLTLYFFELPGPYVGFVSESKLSYFIFKPFIGSPLYISQASHPYEVGDILVINGGLDELSFTHYEEAFNFETFLYHKGVMKELYLKDVQIVFSNLIRPKSWLLNLTDNYKNDAYGLVTTLFNLGTKANKLWLKDFESYSLLYLMSITGVHISFFIGVIRRLLKRKMNKNHLDILILSSLAILFILFSYRSFMLRILVFQSLTILLPYIDKKRNYNRLEIISLTGFVLLVLSPHSLFEASFYYIIPLLIILELTKVSFKSLTKNKKKVAYSLLFVIYFGAIEIFADHQLSILKPLFQLFVTPLYIFIIGFFILTLVNPYFMKPFDGCASTVKMIMMWLRKYDPKLTVPAIEPLYIFLLLALFLAIIILLEIKYYKREKQMMILTLILSSFIFLKRPETEQSVTFIDVGQGDACLIRNKGTNVLIDTGGSLSINIAEEVLMPYFRRISLTSLDAIFISHSDFDHSGALEELAVRFNKAKIIIGNDFYEEKVGDMVFRNYNQKSSEDPNDMSQVLSFSLLNSSFLMMGDAPIMVESEIIKSQKLPKIDYLKVGHHGSKTSSSFKFLDKIKPKLAIISCGKGNGYGHPHLETIENLESLKIKYRRTDLEGSIKITV